MTQIESIPARAGLDGLARDTPEGFILVHRSFPNEQLPVLVYLAHKNAAVPVGEVYAWLKQNEMDIKNPSLSVLRLKEKDLIAAFEKDKTRYLTITEKGSRAITDYIDSLSQADRTTARGR
jgi:hypothetical protein